jgi:hypothetical protein
MSPLTQAFSLKNQLVSWTCLCACAPALFACALVLLPTTLTLSSSARAQEDLSGTYIMFEQTTSVTELPVLKDVTAKMRATTLVNLSHDGNSLRGQGKLCDLHIESSTDLISTEFPAAFKRSLPPIALNLRLRGEGNSMKVTQATATSVLGVKLKDQQKEPLPKNTDDPRVYDQDGDGHPGMTVKVDGIVSGEVYVIQRTTTRLLGERIGASFRGQVIFKNEQKVVGASSVMLNRSPNPKPDLSQSFFRLEKVSPALGCSDAARIAHTFR